MAIEKLNFSGKNFNPTIGKSTSELLIGYGNTLNDKRDNEIALKQKEEAIKYQRSRDALIDSRYEADRKERLDDKFDAKQKDSMTNEALALIGNKDAFLSGKISAENKAYADALSQISDPVERARLEQDIKSYQTSGQQKQSWIDSILGQSNIDNSKILDLKRDMEKEAENKRRFDLQLAETRATRAEAKNERLAREKEKLNAKKAIAVLNADSVIEDPNRSSSGAFYNVNQEKTGNKVVPKDAVIPEGEGSQTLSEIKEISNRIDALARKNRDKDGNEINYENRDEALKVFIKENPEAANASAAGKAVSNGVNSAFNVIKNDMNMPSKMVISGLNFGFNKVKQALMSDIEKEEYNKKLDEAKAKKLQESLKSNSPGEKANDVNISFDNYWDLKKKQQDIDDAELKSLQEELGKKSLTYSDNLANKYGVDEIKSVPKEMTPHQAKIYETKRVTNLLVDKGVDPGIALEVGTKKGEDAYNFQANYIKNVNTDAKESAKNKNENVENAKKKIEEEIKELRKLKNKIGTGGKDKVWYGSELLPIPRAQEEIDNEISRLKKELANLK